MTAIASATEGDRIALGKELQYLSDLFSFRRIIAQNEKDSEDTAPPSPRQILYVADTNALRLCFDPHHNSDLTRPFHFLKRQEDRDVGVAVITAEFLLSGHLPGRRGAPLFVTPTHWREFTGQFEQIISEMTAARRSIDKDDKAKEDLRRRISDIRGKIEIAENDVHKLRGIYNNDIQSLYVDGNLDLFARPKMLTQLLKKGDLIRPLIRAPYITPSLVHEEDSDLDGFWLERLTEVHRRRGTEDKNSRNLKADAEALATIHRLNDDLRERQIPVNAVLVTGDRSILDATIGSPEAGQFGFVRDIRQFIPLINNRDILGSSTLDQTTSRIRLAIDAFLQKNSQENVELSTDSERALWQMELGIKSYAQILLALIRFSSSDDDVNRRRSAFWLHFENEVRKEYGEFLGEALARVLENVSATWNRLIENSRRSHSNLIASYYRDWLSEIAEVFEELNFDTRQELTKSQRAETKNLSSELIRLHLETTLLSDLFAADPSKGRWGETARGILLSEPGAAVKPLEHTAANIVHAFLDKNLEQIRNETIKLCGFNEHPAFVSFACTAVAVQLGRLATGRSLADLTIDLINSEKEPGLEASFELLLARSQYLGALSRRLLQHYSVPEDQSPEVCFNPEECANVCAYLYEILKERNYFAEAAVVKAEIAAATATGIVVDCLNTGKNGNTALPALVRNVVFEASHAIDIASQSNPSEVLDFLGRQVTPVAQAKAGAALVCALVATRLMRIPTPSVANSYVARVAKILRDFHQLDVGGQRFAEPLSEIARGLSTSENSVLDQLDFGVDSFLFDIDNDKELSAWNLTLERDLIIRFLENA